MQVPFSVTQGRYLLAQVLNFVQSLTTYPSTVCETSYCHKGRGADAIDKGVNHWGQINYLAKHHGPSVVYL